MKLRYDFQYRCITCNKLITAAKKEKDIAIECVKCQMEFEKNQRETLNNDLSPSIYPDKVRKRKNKSRQLWYARKKQEGLC